MLHMLSKARSSRGHVQRIVSNLAALSVCLAAHRNHTKIRYRYLKNYLTFFTVHEEVHLETPYMGSNKIEEKEMQRM